MSNAGFFVVRFCNIDPLASDPDCDVLSFPDGTMVLVNALVEGQRARVIQFTVAGQERQEGNIEMHCQARSTI